jgi:putative inorganic carbon (HCO3(-)) transporter
VLLNSLRRIYILATTLFITSLSIALYSIVNYYTKGEIFYIQPLPPWQGETYKTITGAFSYRNHYAAFLNLTIPLGIGLAFYETGKTKIHLRKLTKLVDFVLSKRMFFLFCSLLLFTLLIFNSSRAGIAALLISLALTFSYLVLIKKVRLRLKFTIIYCLTILLLLLAVVASGLADPLIHKAQSFGDNGREKLRQTAVVIIKEHPLMGTGAGTYPTIQARYRSALLYGNKMWQHAHNDYLELIITQGIVGFAIFASALLIFLVLLMQALQARSSQMYSLQIACLWSCLGILIHSIADFNFQLPANTIYFWAILAMGIKITILNKESVKNH